MEIFYAASAGLLRNSAIALGFFDGVHLGHQAVVNQAIETASQKNITSAVVTFKDHPRALTHGNSPLLLTTIEQRLEIFDKLGVEAVLVMTFTEELCRLSPREYVDTVLVNSMGAKYISVGYNHHFGRHREGDPELLAKYGKELKFSVQVVKPVYIDGIEVSSSKIRECLEEANLLVANKLLSRPFSIRGTVVKGDKRGSGLGYPTANLEAARYQMLPSNGVYAARARVLNASDKDIYHDAVVNIGMRPTFDNENNASIHLEVHIFNFSADLYDQDMEIYFYGYIRPECKFSSTEELQKQIQSDCASAAKILAAAK